MTSLLNPYLQFEGSARSALEFYKGVFGGTLSINTYGEFEGSDPADAEKVMHGQLDTDNGYVLMAADAPPGSSFTPANGVVCLSGDDVDDLREYWNKLSGSGSVSVPLEKQMWGAEFGQCKDEFGVEWMINIDAPAE